MRICENLRICENFTRNLNHQILRNSLTSTQVAKHLGVSIPTISRWKSGRQFPKLPDFIALCILLKRSPEQMLCDPYQPSEPSWPSR